MSLLHRLLPPGRSPRTVPFGLFRGIRLNLDLRGELQVFAGLYERETFREIRRLLHGCRGAIDLGAARGDLVIHLLRQPSIERVVAVEPLERERAAMHANLALNGCSGDPRLAIHAGFAGRDEPPLWRTLDDLASGCPAPLFIKIDIDGPEADVVACARATLGTRECRLLIETHSPVAETRCIDILASLGYSTRIINPAWWRHFIPEHRPIPHNRWLVAQSS